MRPARRRPTRVGGSAGSTPIAGDNLDAVRQIAMAIDDLARQAFPTLLRDRPGQPGADAAAGWTWPDSPPSPPS